MTLTLAECAEQLYSADPAEFVANRTALVKQARAEKNRELATEVGRLRRPTVSAWYVNIAARNDLPAMAALLRLGARMRAAQARLDLAEVRDLGATRRQLEQQVLTELRQVLASISVTPSPAAMDEVAATLTAAVADPQAEAAVTSGCLARSLSYAGFGEVDLTDALAAVIDRPAKAPPSAQAVQEVVREVSRTEKTESEAEQAQAEQAQAEQAQAEQAQAEQERALAAARQRRRDRELDKLRTSLAKASSQQQRAQAEVDRLTAALAAATTALTEAIAATDALADQIVDLEST